MYLEKEGGTEPTLRVPDLSNSFRYMSDIHSWLVSDRETEGRFSMLRFLAQPGGEPPAHVHRFEHEIFYVLEGEIEFYIEGSHKSFLATAGTTMHLPRGKAHAFLFRSPRVSSLAMIHAVEGHRTVEAFLKGMALGSATSMELPESAPEYRTLDPEKMRAAAAEVEQYGVTFLTPDEIAKRLPLFPGFENVSSQSGMG